MGRARISHVSTNPVGSRPSTGSELIKQPPMGQSLSNKTAFSGFPGTWFVTHGFVHPAACLGGSHCSRGKALGLRPFAWLQTVYDLSLLNHGTLSWGPSVSTVSSAIAPKVAGRFPLRRLTSDGKGHGSRLRITNLFGHQFGISMATPLSVRPEFKIQSSL